MGAKHSRRENTILPSTALYTAVRSLFIQRGTTFNAWCRERGVDRNWAKAAVQGRRNGPKAEALRREIAMAAIGVGQ